MISNRIPFGDLESDTYDRVKATSIDIQKFLPDDDDFNLLRNRMITLTERSLVTYFPNLVDHKNVVCWHIPHMYSKQSQEKSEMVSEYTCNIEKVCNKNVLHVIVIIS